MNLQAGFLLVLFLGIFGGTLYAQNPYVQGTFPSEGATNLACNTNITVTVRFSPEGNALDLATLTAESVRLYPKGKPRKAIKIGLEYKTKLGYILLTLKERLQPQTIYILEVNNRLTDDRGFAFQPFKLTVQTGDCDQDILKEAEEEMVRGEESRISFKLTHIFARRQGDSVAVGWKAEEHLMVDSYWIEKSINDTVYTLLDTLTSLADTKAEQTYRIFDKNPSVGWNKYRLGMRSMLGDVTFLDTISFFKSGMRIEKLDIQDQLTLDFIIRQPTSVVVLIVDPKSKETLLRKVKFVNPSAPKVEIDLSEMAPGPYYAILRTPEDAIRAKILIRR
ncbi:MAG: Ig-like domain-containing protein [Bacteroidota bacterium]